MNYFNSTEARQLFNCQAEDNVEDCLSRQIDIIHQIIIHKQDVSIVVNKANKQKCELTTMQVILIRQKLQYLRNTYLHVLQEDTN